MFFCVVLCSGASIVFCYFVFFVLCLCHLWVRYGCFTHYLYFFCVCVCLSLLFLFVVLLICGFVVVFVGGLGFYVFWVICLCFVVDVFDVFLLFFCCASFVMFRVLWYVFLCLGVSS